LGDDGKFYGVENFNIVGLFKAYKRSSPFKIPLTFRGRKGNKRGLEEWL